MMVSITLALLMILALIQVFQWMGESVAFGRATIEMSTELQTATAQLQRDLDNITCEVKPWIKPGEGAGYFFYREGTQTDLSSLDPDPANVNPAYPNFFGVESGFGDVDDVLAMTVRSDGKPFLGFDGSGAPIESALAEVLYSLHPSSSGGSIDVYRAVRLILPAAGAGPGNSAPAISLGGDVAVGTVNGQLKALSLTDLTAGNRLVDSYVPDPDDIILRDVLAFDVRCFDPSATCYAPNGVSLWPGDPGYGAAIPTNLAAGVVGRGAFVDLGYAYDLEANPVRLRTGFTNAFVTANPMAGLPANGGVPRYDTMPWVDVMNQLTAVNGLDDDGANGVDDPAERNNVPPCRAQLRGIEVRCRVIEVETGQVMQSSVVGDFVPN